MVQFPFSISDIWSSVRSRAVLLSFRLEGLKEGLKILALYLAFAGIFGFSIFIMEEGIQLLSFANFSASDTRSFALMKQNLEVAKQINNSIKFMNKWFLWLIPPQQAGYARYAQATDQYIATLSAEILANEPILYAGEHIDMRFHWKSYEPGKNGLYLATNQKVTVVLARPPSERTVHIQGIARPDPEKAGGIIIDTTEP